MRHIAFGWRAGRRRTSGGDGHRELRLTLLPRLRLTLPLVFARAVLSVFAPFAHCGFCDTRVLVSTRGGVLVALLGVLLLLCYTLWFTFRAAFIGWMYVPLNTL